MIIDQPPSIIGEITPAMRREIGCAGLWLGWLEAVGGDDPDRLAVTYRRYLARCIAGEAVAIFTMHKRKPGP